MAERLTDRRVAALRAGERPTITFDSEVAGLGLMVRPSGTRSFVFDYREPGGRQRRITFGQPPALTVAMARSQAVTLRRRLDSGEAAVAPAKQYTVGELLDAWLDVVELTRRPLTARAYRRLARCHIEPAFGQLLPGAVSRNLVEAWHGRLAKGGGLKRGIPTDANRALATLSAFFTWIGRDGIVPANPCNKVGRHPEEPRSVFLDATEISVVHAWLDRHANRSAALALRLALLTGARLGEIRLMQSQHVDFSRQVWIKPAASTKGKRLHVVPLPSPAIPLVREYLILGPPRGGAIRYAIKRLRLALNRPELRAHDLRHSMASSLARGGATLLQIGRVLGHASPAITSRYAHLVEADLRDLVEAAATEAADKLDRRQA